MTDHTHYIIHSTVTSIEERSERRHVSGVGAEAVFVSVTIGWFVFLQGSFEAIYLGAEKPELVKGDKVKITIEKETT